MAHQKSSRWRSKGTFKFWCLHKLGGHRTVVPKTNLDIPPFPPHEKLCPLLETDFFDILVPNCFLSPPCFGLFYSKLVGPNFWKQRTIESQTSVRIVDERREYRFHQRRRKVYGWVSERGRETERINSIYMLKQNAWSLKTYQNKAHRHCQMNKEPEINQILQQ